MSVGEAVDKLHPVLLMEGFSNPALEGAKIVNCDFGYVGKEEAEVLDDVVLGVKKRASYWTDIVAACRTLLQHAVSICCARQSEGARMIFPTKSICHAAIMFPTQGTS